MIDETKKGELQQSLTLIKNNLQLLCDSTKKCIRNPSMKVRSDTYVFIDRLAEILINDRGVLIIGR